MVYTDSTRLRCDSPSASAPKRWHVAQPLRWSSYRPRAPGHMNKSKAVVVKSGDWIAEQRIDSIASCASRARSLCALVSCATLLLVESGQNHRQVRRLDWRANRLAAQHILRASECPTGGQSWSLPVSHWPPVRQSRLRCQSGSLEVSGGSESARLLAVVRLAVLESRDLLAVPESLSLLLAVSLGRS